MSGVKVPGVTGLRMVVAALIAAGMLVDATQAAAPRLSVYFGVPDPLADLLVLVDANAGATTSAVRNILAVGSECRRYDPTYRVDCLAQGLKEVSARLPRGEYDKARSILSRASGKLSSLASANADSGAEKLEAAPNANPRLKSKRRYRAVKKEALAAVMKQAQSIVEEAATQLLRSYENSDRRHGHYQKIATATGSLKVLLRS